MHPCLYVDEILRLLAWELVASEEKSAAVALACCCKGFEEPVLDTLWETQDRLTPLLKCFPPDIWKEEEEPFSFERIPTKAEWAHSLKYARRMRKLKVDTSADPVSSDIIQALQPHIVNGPWLPGLKTFKCNEATEAFIPFIPSFLSPQTTRIKIRFADGSPAVVVASIISKFSMLCPNLERITLRVPPRDSVIVDAVSEMVLGCNREVLREFEVDSPLTEEAREVVYQLPKLFSLWANIQGPTSLPTMTLPNLFAIDLRYEHDLDWLEGFRGATLGSLKLATFHSESEHIGDFLQAFESVVLTTSAQNTLFMFRFCTMRSWDPNYSSLLSFCQLQHLRIEFTCDDGCSSKVDDDIIISLAGAMPKLEFLQLGASPCQTPTGITVNGLIGLACRCPNLTHLCVHFQGTSLAEAATSATTPPPLDDEFIVWQQEICVLTSLKVGGIPIPAGSESAITLILLQIFPCIVNIWYTNEEWETVAKTILDFRRIGAFVHRSSDAIGVGRPSGGGQA